MALGTRRNKSFGAANRTIAALKFHAELIREKAGDTSAASDHNEILGNMVDLHHRNMCQVGESLLRFQPFDTCSTELDLEVEDFEVGSSGENNPSDGRDSMQHQIRSSQNTSSLLDSADSQTSAPVKQGSTLPAKKAVQDVDPISLFRHMRAGTMSRGAGNLKGANILLSVPQAVSDDDEEVKVDASLRCGKSFLSRPDQQAGAANDMLAQIRGTKWNSDILSTKSSKSLNGKAGDVFILTTSRPELRGEVMLSSSLGSAIGGFTPGGSKSFTSGSVKRPQILPSVSVDSTPCLLATADYCERVSFRTSAAGPSSGGLLSKLKKIIRQ
ncbi:hypothetical protein Vafri_3598 [Volvox africanus]|uniref:Uncharacterized protein n=1 Tax=Volvox africanus TaxID=51714 RepID=A0A8J4ASK2_9CHLO|nr:hypothetical protein Vafri_3598 [Volvox africanus]